VILLYSPHFFWWIAPIVLPIVLSMPLSVLTSHDGPGRWLRRKKLLLIPEETFPDREIKDVTRFTAEKEAAPVPLDLPREAGFLRVLLDPGLNGLRRALLARRKRNPGPDARARNERLADKLLNQGPDALSSGEKEILLHDPDGLLKVHARAWTAEDDAVRKAWLKQA
jgi:membrane glycosyltransferase